MSKFQVNIEELYDDYYHDVYHFALYYTNNKQEAEDITQETFLKVMQNIHRLKDFKKRNTWILSIARNTAVDIHRKYKLRQLIPSMMSLSYKTSENNTEQQLLLQEEWEFLQEALLTIKPHYRSVIILKGLKEFSIKEIAEILNCTELKVRVDYHRAIAQLKKQVAKG
ncbi:RNA polymerase sigma factor [Viridibacillus arvi]|uniref:RNA polymerase sigma factor n=1 Tax=Viridibacillus arvi TaxID=263475 RepID=UPI00187B4E0A|nr:RNA polymerase sigma factor [Viridibacillus sp. JNUCC-6]QOV12461.1 RNA polymerase sigma factor [Viridibacillus sp. JNUCC-6]